MQTGNRQSNPEALVVADPDPVPVRGGQTSPQLFTTTIDGAPYLVWEDEGGQAVLVPGTCPHKPAAGPTLLRAGVVTRSTLQCTRHFNRYDLRTGACVEAIGQGDPGTLTVRRGRRTGDSFVFPLAEGVEVQ